MDKKNQLLRKIEEKEKQESRASRESESLNKGKYKNSSNSEISKIYLESLRNEIKDLYKKLDELPE